MYKGNGGVRRKMKIRKKTLKRLLFVVMLAIVLSNFCWAIFGGNRVYAQGFVGTMLDSDNGAFAKIEALMSGIVGVLTFLPRIGMLLFGFLIKILMNTCASLGTSELVGVTFEHVFFAGYSKDEFKSIDFIDIDFFDLTGTGAIHSFREAIAQWYYIMRLISAAILLVILIYVGIRMAISTIASDQAKYKQMLVDWVTSLALLFLLHYIIMFIISINSALVSALGGLLEAQRLDKGWLMQTYGLAADVFDSITGGKVTVGEYLNAQIVADIWTDGINGIVAALIYCIMQIQSFGFFLFYLKRMITVGFLIIIAPLITITYSIDKMGDGKAQALNAWLKEISYNILIQPFHCVIYLAFFGAISRIIAESDYGNITAYILVFVVLKFMKEAEGILRKIFHFEANSMPSITEPAKAFGAATGKFAQIGMKAGSAFSNFRAAGGMQKLRDIRADSKLKKDYNKNVDKSKYSTFEQYKNSEEGQQKREEYKHVFKNSKVGKKIRDYKARTLEDKAQESVEANMTQGEKENFREVYNRARGKKKEDMTQEEREAVEKVENKKTEIRENSPMRKISGVKKTFDNFAQSDLGKLAGAYVKDNVKVAAALALGAAGYGIQGSMTDAISYGQLGYGIAYGALEGTTKTATDDTRDLIKQYAHNNNVSPEEMKKQIQDFINECHSMDFAGMFKKIHDDQVKALDALKEIVGDSASKIMAQMIGQTKTSQEYDISELIDTYSTKDLDDKEKTKAIDVIKGFSDLLIKSQVAAQFNVVKSGGMDVDSFGRRVTNNYHTTENNTTNYIYNHEENRYENRYQSNN